VTPRPPMVRPTVPLGRTPDRPLTAWNALVGKPSSLSDAGLPLALSDIPGQVTTTRKFLRSQGTGSVAGTPTWDVLAAADVIGDVAATRKFLRSLGTGSTSGTTVWDTLTAADVGAGTFPVGAFTFQGPLTVNDSGVTSAPKIIAESALSSGYGLLTMNGATASSTALGLMGKSGDGNLYLLGQSAVRSLIAGNTRAMVDGGSGAGTTSLNIFAVDTGTLVRVKTTAAGVAPGASDRTLYV